MAPHRPRCSLHQDSLSFISLLVTPSLPGPSGRRQPAVAGWGCQGSSLSWGKVRSSDSWTQPGLYFPAGPNSDQELPERRAGLGTASIFLSMCWMIDKGGKTGLNEWMNAYWGPSVWPVLWGTLSSISPSSRQCFEVGMITLVQAEEIEAVCQRTIPVSKSHFGANRELIKAQLVTFCMWGGLSNL